MYTKYIFTQKCVHTVLHLTDAVCLLNRLQLLLSYISVYRDVFFFFISRYECTLIYLTNSALIDIWVITISHYYNNAMNMLACAFLINYTNVFGTIFRDYKLLHQNVYIFKFLLAIVQ